MTVVPVNPVCDLSQSTLYVTVVPVNPVCDLSQSTLCVTVARRVKEIEASKAPQVLTIDHDEVEEAEDEQATSSSNEEEDEDSECSSNTAGDGYEAFSRPTSLVTAAESETYEGVCNLKT